jgi:hypothetical protein
MTNKFFRTVHFNEMRELLNDKQDMKHIILDRVDEQLAAEVCILFFFSFNFFNDSTLSISMKMNTMTPTMDMLLVLKSQMHTPEKMNYADHLLYLVFYDRKWRKNRKKKKRITIRLKKSLGITL